MFLALREMKHSKLRYLLIGLIMVLIAWLVLFVSGLAKGLGNDNASALQNMDADYIVLQNESDLRLNRSLLSNEILDQVRSITGEQGATPLGLQMSTLTKEGSNTKTDATFFAIDTNSFIAPTIVEGKMIDNKSAEEVVADVTLKEEGYAIGDRIEDQSSGKTFTIVGFSEGQSYSHSPVIHMNMAGWFALHDADPNSKIYHFNAIALQTTQDNADQISQIKDIEVIAKDDALSGIPGYKEEQGSLLMMIAFLFVIAAFVLAVFFYVITIQKMNQFGVLKAIGAKTGYLVRNVVSQILLLTIVSLVVSIALTYGVAAILPASMPFDLSPSLVALCSVLFIVVSILGSLLSLYRVAKIDAIEAIGRAA
ncbi:ABC transporter permease [Paenibacillus sp. Marseille-Q4541]|uniref:ABC transporter permease n=1 Tax=Paenibacillus sp. Marseille-Q4541 TaxID=2831522 RepID=UPI001BA44DB0|nr:ABC transporter permease [Paenibacillus sp. Marseille-Q4541]